MNWMVSGICFAVVVWLVLTAAVAKIAAQAAEDAMLDRGWYHAFEFGGLVFLGVSGASMSLAAGALAGLLS